MRGSAALATRPLAVAAPAAEALEPGEMRRVPYAGELLGAVRVRGAYAALPLTAFDRASASLEAEEQAAYLQLLRLSIGEGRNFCRAAKRDLGARLRLSERRLLRVLDALVAKGFVKPLHRDNRGTLYRVYLPAEAFGEPLGDDVVVGRASGLSVVRDGATGVVASASAGATSSASAPSPRPPPALRGEREEAHGDAGGEGELRSHGLASSRTPRTGPRPVHTEASLARALAAARGRVDPEGLARAAREVGELVAEGQRLDRIAAAVEAVRRRAARSGHEEIR